MMLKMARIMRKISIDNDERKSYICFVVSLQEAAVHEHVPAEHRGLHVVVALAAAGRPGRECVGVLPVGRNAMRVAAISAAVIGETSRRVERPVAGAGASRVASVVVRTVGVRRAGVRVRGHLGGRQHVRLLAEARS